MAKFINMEDDKDIIDFVIDIIYTEKWNEVKHYDKNNYY